MPLETQIDGGEIIDYVNFDGFKWVGVGDVLQIVHCLNLFVFYLSLNVIIIYSWMLHSNLFFIFLAITVVKINDKIPFTVVISW